MRVVLNISIYLYSVLRSHAAQQSEVLELTIPKLPCLSMLSKQISAVMAGLSKLLTAEATAVAILQHPPAVFFSVGPEGRCALVVDGILTSGLLSVFLVHGSFSRCLEEGSHPDCEAHQSEEC